MRPLGFDKYEGAGNDFLLVEVESEAAVSPKEAMELCDRHYGVGADGVLLVLPAVKSGRRARMVVLNADGSRPEMCGNGLRCVALLLAQRDGAEQTDYVLETDAGDRHARVDRQGAEARVTLGMGAGELRGTRCFVVKGREQEFLDVSMGNPHAIAFVSAVTEAEIDVFGPEISKHTEGGTNVEVVSARPDGGFSVLVWERGVGRTLACGTGAAAVAVAAATTGRAPFGRPMIVELPGGTLHLTVTEGSLDVTLEGPARHVFAGKVGG
jgi:diaminopimelate epimerase